MKGQERRLAIGDSDFKTVRQQKRLIVDKSLFIKEIIDDATKVKLIIRPRRFGKTFNMSMLKYFFDQDEKAHDLFHDLKIEKAGAQYQREQGQYPVLFITFKDIKADNFEEAYEEFQQLLAKLYKQYKEYLFASLFKTNYDEQKDYQAIIDCKATKVVTKKALKNLTEYLNKAYNKRVIVLIDEYDTPINHSYQHDYYSAMAEFMRGLLSPVLKDNPALHQAVLTGILRVAKESIFSGLNNVVVYSLLADTYSTYFGFTIDELHEPLNLTDSDLLEQLEEWYGGYQVGKRSLFNPWSIVNFINSNYTRHVNEKQFDIYWVNTSGNELIETLLKQHGNFVKNVFRELLENKPVAQTINEHTVFADIKTDSDALWSFLALQGYLTITTDPYEINDSAASCQLIVPNKELYRFYEKHAKTWFKGENVTLQFKRLEKPDVALIEIKNAGELASQLKTALMNYYQKQAQVKRLYDGTQFAVTDTFINLQLVDEGRQKTQERYFFNTARQQLANYEDIYQPKGDIFAPDDLQVKAKGRQHTLIVGRAGIGKTTVCQYYAARWSAKENPLWQNQFDWVFWIPLRQLASVDSFPLRDKPYELIDVVHKSCFPAKNLRPDELNYLRYIIKKASDRILWIVDGYDEVSPLKQRIPRFQRLLESQLLTQPYVLITSRPQTAQEIKADYRLENIGFSQANIKAYITHFFANLPLPNSVSAERLEKFLLAHPSIQSVAHIPICLELICSIWDAKLSAYWQEDASKILTDFTLTDLYQDIVTYYLHRYVGTEKNALTPQAEVYQKAQPILHFLEQLAMEGLLQNTLELSADLIQRVLKESEMKESLQEGLNTALERIGLLKPLAEPSATTRGSYYFVHLSFQEYLAARYLHRWLNDSSGNNSFPLKQNSSTDTNAWQWIAAHSGGSRYENLWAFVAGLLRHHLPQLETFFDQLLVGKTNEALLKEDPYRLLLTLRCLEACNLAAIPQRERLLKLYLTYAERILLRYVEGTAPVLVKLQAIYQQLITYLRISPQIRRAARIDELLTYCSEEKSGSLFAPKFDFNMPISTLAKQQAFLASLDLETQNEGLFKSLAAVIQNQTQRYDLATQERAIRRLGSLEVYHNGTPDLLRQAAKQPRLQPAALTVAGKLAPQDHLLINFLIEVLIAPGLSRMYALRELQNLIAPRAKQTTKAYAVTRLEEVINAQLSAAENKLTREQPQVWEVLGWLGQISLPNFITPIEQTLLLAAFDESKVIKEASITALKQLGKAEDTQLLHFLIRVYGDFAETRVQQQIAEVLMSLSGTHAIELLLAYLKEPAAVVSKPVVLQLLTQFEYPEKDSAIMVALEESCLSDLKDENSDIKYAAAIVLGRLGRVTPAIRDNLFLALKSTNHILQKNARKTLTALNEHTPALMDPLLGALLIGMSSQRKDAIEIIENLGSAEPRLINALLQKLEDPHAEVQEAAAAALGNIAGAFPEVTLVFLKALEDKKGSVRRVVARVLGKMVNASPKILPALLKALEDKEWIVRRAAADALSKVANVSPEAVPTLLKALEDKEWIVRRAAADALRKVEKVSSEAIPALLKALESNESDVRHAVAKALGKVEKVSPEVVLALLKALEDEEWIVQQAAVDALGKVEKVSPEVVPALLKVLEGKESDVRRAAVDALGKVEKFSPEIVPTLLKALESNEGDVRRVVAKALGQVANVLPEVVPALFKALKSKVGGVRQVAVDALGQLSNVLPEVVPALLKALEDKEWDVRWAAVAALRKVANASPKVVPALLKVLKSKESGVRCTAVTALGQVANVSPEVVPALLKALEDKESDVRQVAVAVLGEVTNASPKVMLALLKVLEDKESNVRRAAVAALGQLANVSPKIVPALVKALEDKESDVRWVAVAVLGQVANVSPEAVPALLKALEDKKWDVRRVAVDALGKLVNASPKVVPALLKVLEDKERGVRRAAVAALDEVTKVSPDIVPALVKTLKSKESDVRQVAVAVLGKVTNASPEVVPALLKALEDKESDDVRQAVIDALGKVVNASPKVVLVLLKALESKEGHVRQAAVKALSKRTNINPQDTESLLEALRIDIPAHEFDPPLLIQPEENNLIIKAFIRHYYNSSAKYQEINVPNDNNCLFWSAAIALLLPVLDDNKAFLTTYERLFGTTGSITLESKRDTTEIKISDLSTQEGVRAMLRTYDCQQNTPLQFQGNALGKLVCHVFRNHVVDQMEQKWDEATKESIRIESGKQDWKSYATGMRALTGWGGEPEIRAISQLIQVNIQVSGQGYRREYKIDGANTTLYLMHANVEKAVGGNNHYHFGLHNDLYQAQIKPFSSSRLPLGNPVKDTTTVAITSSHVPAKNPARLFTPVGSNAPIGQTHSAVDIANQPHRSHHATTRLSEEAGDSKDETKLDSYQSEKKPSRCVIC